MSHNEPTTTSKRIPLVREVLADLDTALSRLIIQAVGSAFGISEMELKASTRRCAAVAFARQVAMYLAHIACGYTLTEVGIMFQRDRTTAAYACRKIEDSRDDPDLDFCLDCLESAVRGWIFQQNHMRLAND